MKIQINSLEALERLIGGDTQIEFDIRQSVAENFAKKHLKTIANDELSKGCERTAVKILAEEFFTGGYSGTYLRTPHFDSIKRAVQIELNEAIKAKALEIIGAANVKEQLEILIAEQAAKIAGEMTDANIMERINKAADLKIKERLGV